MLAPADLRLSPDYAVDADLTVIRWSPGRVDTFVGIVARFVDNNGYLFGFDGNRAGIAAPSYSDIQFLSDFAAVPYEIESGTALNIRAEVQANQFRLLLDGRVLCQGLDNHILTAGRIGLICSATQISVSSVVISAL